MIRKNLDKLISLINHQPYCAIPKPKWVIPKHWMNAFRSVDAYLNVSHCKFQYLAGRGAGEVHINARQGGKH